MSHTAKFSLPANLNLNINHKVIERKSAIKFLGVYIDDKLIWDEHISHINSKLSSALYVLRNVKGLLPRDILRTLYHTLIQPHLMYGVSCWGSAANKYLKRTQVLQRKAMRIICNTKYNAQTQPLFKSLKLLKLNDLYTLEVSKFMHSVNNHTLPSNLMNMFISTGDIHN